MSEESQKLEKQPQRHLETFEEKLDFLVTRFVTKTGPIKDHAEADVLFEGDLFSGKLSEEIKKQVQDGLGVDIDSDPDFGLSGNDLTFNVWKVPTSDPTDSVIYVLRRDVGDETDLTVYGSELLELMEMTDSLERT